MLYRQSHVLSLRSSVILVSLTFVLRWWNALLVVALFVLTRLCCVAVLSWESHLLSLHVFQSFQFVIHLSSSGFGMLHSFRGSRTFILTWCSVSLAVTPIALMQLWSMTLCFPCCHASVPIWHNTFQTLKLLPCLFLIGSTEFFRQAHLCRPLTLPPCRRHDWSPVEIVME